MAENREPFCNCSLGKGTIATTPAPLPVELERKQQMLVAEPAKDTPRLWRTPARRLFQCRIVGGEIGEVVFVEPLEDALLVLIQRGVFELALILFK